MKGLPKLPQSVKDFHNDPRHQVINGDKCDKWVLNMLQRQVAALNPTFYAQV